jgi:hypothetical protein
MKMRLCPARKKEPDKSKKDKSKKKDRESPDFTIELVTSDGVTATAPVSRFAAIPPPLKEKFTKLDVMESAGYEKDWEPVFQTVRAPLSAFQAAGAGRFDPSRLTVVRLKFDRTPMSVICVSSVGFGRLE